MSGNNDLLTIKNAKGIKKIQNVSIFPIKIVLNISCNILVRIQIHNIYLFRRNNPMHSNIYVYNIRITTIIRDLILITGNRIIKIKIVKKLISDTLYSYEVPNLTYIYL